MYEKIIFVTLKYEKHPFGMILGPMLMMISQLSKSFNQMERYQWGSSGLMGIVVHPVIDGLLVLKVNHLYNVLLTVILLLSLKRIEEIHYVLAIELSD